jgi:O-antigen/teichoic acid export membrane protein
MNQANSSPSLERRAIRGSVWTLAGYGLSQVFRLGGNLVLTRLLTPEAFGLMALVQTFLIGLQMFSDFGILPNIIQSERGEDPKFLNTAWTIQAVRGGALWIGACLLAWPVAQFYREPLLNQLLPVAGLTVLIMGFNSTKLATANRRLAMAQLTLLELGTSLISLLVMIGLALIYRSVWALVIGSLIGSLLKMLASHLLSGESNRFAWDQQAVAEIQKFGRWIFLSTIVGFFALQSDRLVLGRLLDVSFLGIYTIALTLSGVVEQIVDQVNSKVLFPTYAELVRERPAALYGHLRRARSVLLGLSCGCALLFVLAGQPLIDLLYDQRYAQAGWMLRVLSIGFLGRVLCITYSDVLMARGLTFQVMTLTVIHTLFQFVAMLVGYSLGGYIGVIVGIAVTDWLSYIAYGVCFARLSLWQPEIDLPVVGLAVWLAAVVYFG